MVARRLQSLDRAPPPAPLLHCFALWRFAPPSEPHGASLGILPEGLTTVATGEVLDLPPPALRAHATGTAATPVRDVKDGTPGNQSQKNIPPRSVRASVPDVASDPSPKRKRAGFRSTGGRLLAWRPLKS